jgi:ATP-dependent Lon protease
VDLVPVDHMDEVLKKALVLDDPESLFKEVPPPVPESVYVPSEQPSAEIQAH